MCDRYFLSFLLQSCRKQIFVQFQFFVTILFLFWRLPNFPKLFNCQFIRILFSWLLFLFTNLVKCRMLFDILETLFRLVVFIMSSISWILIDFYKKFRLDSLNLIQILSYESARLSLIEECLICIKIILTLPIKLNSLVKIHNFDRRPFWIMVLFIVIVCNRGVIDRCGCNSSRDLDVDLFIYQSI